MIGFNNPRRLAGLAAACALLFSATAPAQDVDAEAAIEYRQSAFKMIFWNFSTLSAMARERIEFDRDEFRMRALRVSNYSRQLAEGFAPGTDSGAPTDAKAEIWANKDDFDAKLADFQRESHKLYSMAAKADEASLREQFSAVSATCKACHDNYRKD